MYYIHNYGIVTLCNLLIENICTVWYNYGSENHKSLLYIGDDTMGNELKCSKYAIEEIIAYILTSIQKYGVDDISTEFLNIMLSEYYSYI